MLRIKSKGNHYSVNKIAKSALIGGLFLSGVLQAQNRTISVDLSKEKGALNTQYKACIGAGRAYEGLRADWQQQLAYVKQECDFKYIRMHGLLTDDMAVYREDKDGNPEYNYQNTDAPNTSCNASSCNFPVVSNKLYNVGAYFTDLCEF